MKHIVLLENIRSAYNVGNIIRTADALGFNVVLSGYTASPVDDIKVQKTSLGAEVSVELQQFWNPAKACDYIKELGYTLIAAELTEKSIAISEFVEGARDHSDCPYAIVFGNERSGVLPETMEIVKELVHISMSGVKESLNVGQAAAIFMREFRKIAHSSH